MSSRDKQVEEGSGKVPFAGNIIVMVKNSNGGNRYPNVQVNVTPGNTLPLNTGQNGEVTFPSLPNGLYTIEVNINSNTYSQKAYVLDDYSTHTFVIP